MRHGSSVNERICCFLSFMFLNEVSLFVGQEKQFEDVPLGSENVFFIGFFIE